MNAKMKIEAGSTNNIPATRSPRRLVVLAFCDFDSERLSIGSDCDGAAGGSMPVVINDLSPFRTIEKLCPVFQTIA